MFFKRCAKLYFPFLINQRDKKILIRKMMEQPSTDESVASIDIDKSLAGCDIGSSVSPSGVKSNPHPASIDETNIIGGGGGTTRPLPRDGGAEELRGDPTVGPHPKVWTIDRE